MNREIEALNNVRLAISGHEKNQEIISDSLNTIKQALTPPTSKEVEEAIDSLLNELEDIGSIKELIPTLLLIRREVQRLKIDNYQKDKLINKYHNTDFPNLYKQIEELEGQALHPQVSDSEVEELFEILAFAKTLGTQKMRDKTTKSYNELKTKFLQMEREIEEMETIIEDLTYELGKEAIPSIQLNQYKKLLDELDIEHLLCTNRLSNNEKHILKQLKSIGSDEK